MKALIRLLVWIASASFVLMGCERDKPYVEPHTLSIFPNQAGNIRITYVEDTTFNSAGINQPLVDTYFKQYILGDTVEYLSGRDLREVNVYRSPVREDSVFNWSYDRLWTQFFEPAPNGNYYAERIEQNQRVVVLQFPVFPGVTWNGNLFNVDNAQEFFYERVDSTVIIRGKRFDNCVVVIQEAEIASFITDNFAYEIYAPNVGLIKKYRRKLIFDGPNGEFNPDESFIYQEEIVDFAVD
ncbi:MAG: hypothetical protein AAF804_10615 [Bacteroidota bacterium]